MRIATESIRDEVLEKTRALADLATEIHHKAADQINMMNDIKRASRLTEVDKEWLHELQKTHYELLEEMIRLELGNRAATGQFNWLKKDDCIPEIMQFAKEIRADFMTTSRDELLEMLEAYEKEIPMVREIQQMLPKYDIRLSRMLLGMVPHGVLA